MMLVQGLERRLSPAAARDRLTDVEDAADDANGGWRIGARIQLHVPPPYPIGQLEDRLLTHVPPHDLVETRVEAERLHAEVLLFRESHPV
jgi:hypothetical protein